MVHLVVADVVERGCGVRQEEEKDDEEEKGKEQEVTAVRDSRGGEHGPVAVVAAPPRKEALTTSMRPS